MPSTRNKHMVRPYLRCFMHSLPHILIRLQFRSILIHLAFCSVPSSDSFLRSPAPSHHAGIGGDAEIAGAGTWDGSRSAACEAAASGCTVPIFCRRRGAPPDPSDARPSIATGSTCPAATVGSSLVRNEEERCAQQRDSRGPLADEAAQSLSVLPWEKEPATIMTSAPWGRHLCNTICLDKLQQFTMALYNNSTLCFKITTCLGLRRDEVEFFGPLPAGAPAAGLPF